MRVSTSPGGETLVAHDPTRQSKQRDRYWRKDRGCADRGLNRMKSGRAGGTDRQSSNGRRSNGGEKRRQMGGGFRPQDEVRPAGLDMPKEHKLQPPEVSGLSGGHQKWPKVAVHTSSLVSPSHLLPFNHKHHKSHTQT